MPLPSAFAKTWQFQVNQTLSTTGVAATDYQTMVLKIKQLLVGFTTQPWTVVSSSNGTGTAGNSDNWTSTANIVWAASGSNHSWIVLAQSGIGSGFQLCIDLCSGTKSNATISFSPNAGFTGGTATAGPTATDEVFLIGTAHNSAGAFLGTLNGSSCFQAELHAIQSTDGQCTRFWLETCSSNEITSFFALFDKPNNPVTGSPGWANPCVGIWSTTLMSMANFNVSSANGCKGRANGVVMPLFLTAMGHGAGPVVSRQMAPSTFAQEFPFSAIGLFSNTTSAIGRHGSLFDLWWCSGMYQGGNNSPFINGRAFYQSGISLRVVGQLLVPWNRSTPLTA